jgi:hypothetical protein
MDRNKEFLTKLASLLKEYDMTIGFEVGEHSDTYGLYDECMSISNKYGIIIKVGGYEIEYSDLELNNE